MRDAQIKSLGADHPDTLNTTHHLAGAHLYSGHVQRAIELYEPVRAARLKSLGPDHPDTISTLNNLAVAYQDAGKLSQAIDMLEQVKKARLRQNGPDHPETLSTLNFLASVYKAAGKPESPLPIVEQIYSGIAKRQFEHQYAGAIMANVIDFYEQLNQDVKAQSLRQSWLMSVKDRYGADSPAYASELASEGLAFKKKKWPDAERMLRECLAIREKTLPDDWTTANTKSMLGEALSGQKNYEGIYRCYWPATTR